MPNLYRHYKNKPYRYIGIVKHSETLEEMAFYETLYENSEGKLWVRPKEMFFEKIDLNGTLAPRFAKVTVGLEEKEVVGAAEARLLAPLIQEIFGEWKEEAFLSKLKSHARFHLVLARIDGVLAGFKLGYAEDDLSFYSWLGGVSPAYRRVGVATALAEAQEAWCGKNGFKTIFTKTKNKFKEMLLLNLRQGFQVVGFQDAKDGGKIILEKSLIKNLP